MHGRTQLGAIKIWYLLMGVISSSEKSGLNLLLDTDQIKYQYSDLKPDPFF